LLIGWVLDDGQLFPYPIMEELSRGGSNRNASVPD